MTGPGQEYQDNGKPLSNLMQNVTQFDLHFYEKTGCYVRERL